jgi:ABC-type multidrug transport system fused ATPase/permease subunit
VPFTEVLAEALVCEWIKLYKRSPKITVIATIVSVLLMGTGIYLADQRSREALELKRLQSLSYERQVKALDETRVNLRSLIEFVDNERRQLELSQQALQSIKSEQERLKPLVESDRKVIDAFFAAQEAQNQAAQSTERWTGFILGVLASLIASFVWAAIVYAFQIYVSKKQA